MEEVLLIEYQKIKIIATQRELEVFSFCKCNIKPKERKCEECSKNQHSVAHYPPL